MSLPVVGLIVVFSHCTESHDVSSRGGASIEAGRAYCARLGALQCEGEELCCDMPDRSAENCRRAVTLDCERSLFLDRIAASPRSGFDAAAAERVFDELERRVRRCDPFVLGWASSDAGLRSMFSGTLGAGEHCEPEGGLADRGAIAAALSACIHADRLACLPDGLLGEWRCAPRQPAGQSCITDDNCERDAVCDNFSQAALGTCVARLPLGAACMYSGECQSRYCDGTTCAEPTAGAIYCEEL